MATDAHLEANARALGAALDAIEAALDSLLPGAGPDVVARTLAGPVRAFDAAAEAAAKGEGKL
mgnify:CR=1 FL=1